MSGGGGGGAAKSRGGGHVNFHVASRGGGVAINFDFPAGGSCLNCFNKIILKNPRSLVFIS